MIPSGLDQTALRSWLRQQRHAAAPLRTCLQRTALAGYVEGVSTSSALHGLPAPLDSGAGMRLGLSSFIY